MKTTEANDIVLASDHAGYELKRVLIAFLLKKGYSVIDLGPRNRKSVHYPDFGQKVAEAVANGEVPLGVLICGTGIGMSMVANRYPGVRAALCHDAFTARMAKAHNNANVLCLGARVIGAGVAEDVLDVWLKTTFEEGRHQERIEMFDACGSS